jgi:predicted nucleic acid-binding protein
VPNGRSDVRYGRVDRPGAQTCSRGGAVLSRLRGAIQIEPIDETIVKLAGEALAWLGRRAGVDASLTIDAIVMASAARRGDVVYTSDVHDLRRFQQFFPGVKVLSV